MNRSDIRTNMRLLLNEDVAGFWQDADLNKCIDLACLHVNSIISATRKEYFTKSATFTTTVNAGSYQLPSDARFIRRLELYIPSDPNDIRKLDELKFPRTEAQGAWPFASTGEPKRFRLVGNHYELWPIPDAVYNMRLYYDWRQDTLTLDADIPTAPEDFHDVIVYWGCVMATSINGNPQEDNLATYSNLFAMRKGELISSLINRGGDDPEVIESYMEGWQ